MCISLKFGGFLLTILTSYAGYTNFVCNVSQNFLMNDHLELLLESSLESIAPGVRSVAKASNHCWFSAAILHAQKFCKKKWLSDTHRSSDVDGEIWKNRTFRSHKTCWQACELSLENWSHYRCKFILASLVMSRNDESSFSTCLLTRYPKLLRLGRTQVHSAYATITGIVPTNVFQSFVIASRSSGFARWTLQHVPSLTTISIEFRSPIPFIKLRYFYHNAVLDDQKRLASWVYILGFSFLVKAVLNWIRLYLDNF